MEIFNMQSGTKNNITDVLYDSYKKPFAGFITGPITMIIGTAQAALNLVAIVFSALCVVGVLHRDKWYSIEKLGVDCLMGLAFIVLGFVFTMPCTSFTFCGDHDYWKQFD